MMEDEVSMRRRKRMRWVVGVILVLALGLAGWVVAPVRAEDAPWRESYGGRPLCLPGVYLSDPGDCLPLGPAQRLTEWARLGLTLPPRPLPATSPDPALNESPALIARINLPAEEPAPLYASLEDAVAGQNPVRFIDPGPLRYVSYVEVQRVNGKPFVRLRSGEWLRASPIAYATFQGLVFHATPTHDFGWIVDLAGPAEVRAAPGYAAPKTGTVLKRYQVVPIYTVQRVGNMDWYMIGPDQWIERTFIRQVRVNPTPPPGVEGNRWIEVNLYDQTVAVYDGGRLVFATLIASGGEPFYTRPGLFKIYKKKMTETMSGAFAADRSDYYYLEDVPWTMYFDEARALHGAYWRAWFGFPQTHGCVNMSLGDAHWLFEWAHEGDWVYVWDPSGQTPTDPSLYTPGGA